MVKDLLGGNRKHTSAWLRRNCSVGESNLGVGSLVCGGVQRGIEAGVFAAIVNLNDKFMLPNLRKTEFYM